MDHNKFSSLYSAVVVNESNICVNADVVNAQSGEVYSLKSPVEPPYPTTTEIATRPIVLKTKKINEFLFASKSLIGMKPAFTILGLHVTSETVSKFGHPPCWRPFL